MPTIASLNVALTATGGAFDSVFHRGSKAVQSFQSSVTSATAPVTAFAGSITGMVAAAVGLGSLTAALGFGIKLAADAEQAEIAFTTMLGSAEAAKSMLEELKAFAASTPFELPELRDAAKKLIAFGVSADQVVPSLRRIGDIAAGLGVPVGELAEIYGKAKVQGRLFAEDINQLTGRGIPIIQQLAAQFGVTEQAVRKLVESGQVNFSNLEQAFVSLTNTGGQFAGLMEAQSQSLGGLWSTLKDNIGASLGEIGAGIIEAFDLKTVIGEASGYLQQYSAQITEGVVGAIRTLVDFAKSSLPAVVEGIAYVADAAQMVGQAFTGAFLIAQIAVNTAIQFIVDGLQYLIESAQSAAEMIGYDLGAGGSGFLKDFSAGLDATIADTTAQFAEMEIGNTWGDSIRSGWKDIKAESKVAAKDVAVEAAKATAAIVPPAVAMAKEAITDAVAVDSFQKAPEAPTSGPALAIEGTQEFFKAIHSFGRNDGDKVPEKQLEEAKRANRHLETIAKGREAGGDATLLVAKF